MSPPISRAATNTLNDTNISHGDKPTGSDPSPKPPPFPRTVAIIGASISGLSLALALVRANHFAASAITIYDLRDAPSSSTSSSSSNDITLPPTPQSGFNPSTTASGIILTPNGLSVLLQLGILEQIAPHCWTATHRTFRSDPGDVLVKKVRISGKELGYGFENHRCWRSLLVRELLAEVERFGVRIRWGWRFEGVVVDSGGGGGGAAADSESAKNSGVNFCLVQSSATENRGERKTTLVRADMLVGADGIYSTVRKYLDPTARPIYTGTTGVLAHIRWEDVDWPRVTSPATLPDPNTTADSTSTQDFLNNSEREQEQTGHEHDYERQCTLQGTPGALFWLPEDRNGSIIMVGKQTRMAEPRATTTHTAVPATGAVDGRSTREAWEKLSQDKEFLTSFFKAGYDDWGETGRKIIDAVCDAGEGRGRETLYLWPFLRMERLERWFTLDSDSGPAASPPTPHTQTQGATLILILGDAAHALPPSSGQGVNQTLEDVYLLCKVLDHVKTGRKDMGEALRFWQSARQQRVDEVGDWAAGITNVSRLSKEEREKEAEQKGKEEKRKADDMRWLYMPRWDEVVDRWVDGQ